MSLKLSDDAQMWADKTYAKTARQIDKEYQDKLTQFSMGLIQREDVERRHGTYGYIEARILANETKARRKAEILRQAYERDGVALSPNLIDEIMVWVGSTLESLNADLMIFEKQYLEDVQRKTGTSDGHEERLSRTQKQLLKSWTDITAEVRENLQIRLADQRLNKKDPSQKVIRVIEPYSFHGEIEQVSGDLYRNGHFREAASNSFIRLIEAVKRKSALPLDGDDLMNKAFGCDKARPPVVQFNNLASEADFDEQRGFMFLFKGIVQLRNKKAHVIETLQDPSTAHDYLALASLLMRLLDSAKVNVKP
jgi:uncharacterized protein (TIGR02391 family)